MQQAVSRSDQLAAIRRLCSRPGRVYSCPKQGTSTRWSLTQLCGHLSLLAERCRQEVAPLQCSQR